MTRRTLLIGSTVAGVLGAIALGLGAASSPTQAAFAYLTAWTYAVSIALGALIFLMITHAIGAAWPIVFRRFAEAIASTLPVLAVMFVPIALAMPRLYAWVAPSPTLGHDALVTIAHKAPYLNVTFFLVRAALCFALWIAVAELLRSWAARLATNDERYRARLRVLSCAALPPVAIALTFAAFDWLMSLTPTWYSTIFGLLYFSGGFVAALALVAVIARGARHVELVRTSIGASHTGALGRLVFAFLVFWAYMEFSQGIIVWIANKPGEVPWYVARGAGGWGCVFAVLVVGHFALPFFALLSKPLKRRPTLLAIAAGWLVAMHYVDVYWLVMPVLHAAPAVCWLDVAAPVCVLGLATAFAAVRARGLRAVADDDPRFADALRYEGS